MEIPVLAVTAVLLPGRGRSSWGRSARYRHRVWRGARDELRRRRATPSSLAWGVVPQGPAHRDLLRHRRRGHRRAGRSPTRRRRRSSSAPSSIPAVISLVMWRALHPRGPAGPEPRSASSGGPRRCSPRRSWRPAVGRAPGPRDLPDLPGFEVGRVYQPGTGLMAGDFYDVFRVGADPGGRGHRRRHRPRHRAVDHRLPGQVPAAGVPPAVPRPGPGPRGAQQPDVAARPRPRSSSRSCVVVFDTEAGTLRYASAGHPPAGCGTSASVQPAAGHRAAADARPRRRATLSREIALDADDLLPALHRRPGRGPRRRALFGEERIAAAVRRDPGVAADVLCKSLLEAARDFANGPITDDIADPRHPPRVAP